MGRRTYTYDGSDWVGLTSTTADLSSYANMTTTPISGFRNAIINGGMNIWQRGTSFTSSGSFTADRFFALSDASFTASRQTFSAGELTGQGVEPTYFHRIAKSAGGGYSTVAQKIESVRTFAGSSFTISLWAKANTSQVLYVRPRQEFGSGGSASVTLTEQSVTLTSTWTRYKFTFTAPSIAGKTIGANDNVLLEIYTVGSGAVTWDIWGVQAELGSIATPFEQRPIGTELALCQRYFWRWSGAGGTGYTYYSMGQARAGSSYVLTAGVTFPVTMRVIPTITISNLGAELPNGGTVALVNETLTGGNLSSNSVIGFYTTRSSGTWAADSVVIIRANNTTAAYVDHSAEL